MYYNRSEDMQKGTYTLLHGLRRGELSRNKHFAAFETAEARRAQRIHRRLAGLSRELLAPGVALSLVSPRAVGAPFALLLERAEVRMRRVAYLCAEELALLCDDPRVRAKIQR
jgi:hypothetical protein